MVILSVFLSNSSSDSSSPNLKFTISHNNKIRPSPPHPPPLTFDSWKVFQNITYSTPEEEAFRHKIFTNNKLQLKPFQTLTSLADQTPLEFAQLRAAAPIALGGGVADKINSWSNFNYNPNSNTTPPPTTPFPFLLSIFFDTIVFFMSPLHRLYDRKFHTNAAPPSLHAPPSAYDWSIETGAVGPIRNQGKCGACWAISVVNTVEAANYIQLSAGVFEPICAAQLVNCDARNFGCKGGWPRVAFDYSAEFGLQYSTDGGTCVREDFSGKCAQTQGQTQGQGQAQNQIRPPIRTKKVSFGAERCSCYVTGRGCECATTARQTELALSNLLTYGPGSVCFDAEGWMLYGGESVIGRGGEGGEGYRCSSEFANMNHCALLVGYVVESFDGDGRIELGHWVVKNTWGVGWGNEGFAKVDFNNNCGVLSSFLQVELEEE